MSDRAWRLALGMGVAGAILALVIGLAVVAQPAFAQPAVPHSLDGRSDCLSCHGPDKMKPQPADHAGRPNESCLACHQVAAAPTPVPLAMHLDNADCLGCHREQSVGVMLPSGETLPTSVSPAAFAGSVHGGKIECLSCHTDKTTFPHKPVTASDRAQYTAERIQVCSTCHQQVADTYWSSTHGQLVKAGRKDAPTCVTCHSKEANPHTIGPAEAPDSPVADRNQASEVCGKCHTKELATYETSVHGKTMLLGTHTDAATCIDCHGVYGVARVHSPERPVDDKQLAQACAKCHPGADASFASGWTGHEPTSPSWFPAAFFTERFLFFLTIGVVSFGSAHVGLDMLRWLVDRVRGRRPGEEKKETDDGAN